MASLGIDALITVTQDDDIFLGTQQNVEISPIVIGAGQNLVRGACLAMKNAVTTYAVDEVTAAASTTNTGDGELTLATPAYAAGVKAGIYKVIFINESPDLGDFIVEDPDGIFVGGGEIGVAFTGIVKFTIADGLYDFIAGDYFNITVTMTTTVTPSDGYYYLWDTDLTDGREVLLGVLVDDADATLATVKGSMYVQGVFNKDSLTAGHTIATGQYKSGTIVIKEELA